MNRYRLKGMQLRQGVGLAVLVSMLGGPAWGGTTSTAPAGDGSGASVWERAGTAGAVPALFALQQQSGAAVWERAGTAGDGSGAGVWEQEGAAEGASDQGSGPGSRPEGSGGLSLEERLGPEPPAIDDLDRLDLTKWVRRSLVRQVRGDEVAEEPVYTPASLENVNCRAAVTLRRNGRLLGTADSEKLPVMKAVQKAGLKALENAARKVPVDEADLGGMGLEIELIGEAQHVGHGGEMAERLATHFEPAVHGIGLRFAGNEILVRPSQLISIETFCDDDGELGHRCDRYKMTIESLQEKLGLLRAPPERPPESVSLWRFRTTHWFQMNSESDPVPLIAGMRLVRPEEVSIESMRAAADDLGRYLRHRQNADGIFSYEYLPGRDAYWLRDQNWVRQAGTAWVVARYARIRSDSQAAEASERAIAGLGTLVRPVSGNPRAAYLHTPDDLHSLGTAALYALALMDSPVAERHQDVLAALMAGIEGMQQEDGSFRGHFPPSQKVASQDYYPGEALLAIARYYSLHPDGERRALCDKSLPFYIRYFREKRVPAFVPWHAQAWGEMARTTRLSKYADFVFEMTDWLIGMQIEESRLPMAIYDGGIDTTAESRAGVSTAVYLEGIVDAIRTADAFGDSDRAARYREAARRAARMVVQLRFREEECYYVQSPLQVLGGLRNTPINPTLRIDHSQHGLAGLMGAAEVLEGGTRTEGQRDVGAAGSGG